MSEQSVHITTAEVAEIAFVDPATVRRWVADGVLRYEFKTIGGHYRFSRTYVEQKFSRRAVAS